MPPRKIFLFLSLLFLSCSEEKSDTSITDSSSDCWTGAGIYQIPADSSGELIRYGRELIVHTARYLGPKGSVNQITNGMNCQNCHLEAGTKPWGNNYGSVASNYPLYRDRSGTLESIEKRINDCIERSLQGKIIDTNSREMIALKSYIVWLGKDVPKGEKVKGSGIMLLPLMEIPANPSRGKVVYQTQCSRCHGSDGRGLIDSAGIEYTYPPLWGPGSYTTGAGMYRLSRLAGFVKNNMPNPLNYHQPILSDQEAWDVAAFVNSQYHPPFDSSGDWPDIRKKPFDYPFGPYADSCNESQHKLGPWKSLIGKK